MAMTHESGPNRKRERSRRYPGRTLADCLELAKFVEDRGLDGFPALEIASALGFSSLKTNTFSATLSAARQFGLLESFDKGYRLTPLAKSIEHPVTQAEVPCLIRTALWAAPLYRDLAERFSDKPVPDVVHLANLLYHQFGIIAAAKDSAASMFLESARFAGVLAEGGVLRPDGIRQEQIVLKPVKPKEKSSTVRLDLRLWGVDEGKTIRSRSPEKISRESYERFLQAFALMVRIE